MKTQVSLLSQEIMLHSLYEEHREVLALTQRLKEARARRDEKIYDCKANQVSMSRISKTIGMSVTNMQPILEKVERRRNGFAS